MPFLDFIAAHRFLCAAAIFPRAAADILRRPGFDLPTRRFDGLDSAAPLMLLSRILPNSRSSPSIFSRIANARRNCTTDMPENRFAISGQFKLTTIRCQSPK